MKNRYVFYPTFSNFIESANFSQGNRSVLFANSYSIALASRYPDYANALSAADCLLADGKPLSLLLRLKYLNHFNLIKQQRGIDILKYTLSNSKSGYSNHFFVGTTDSNLAQIKKVINKQFPNANVIGTYSPNFTDSYENWIKIFINMTEKSTIDYLWIALGTPKQDLVIDLLRKDLKNQNCLILGVGAAVNFITGEIKEAPNVLKILGFEWLYRFLKEPKRLWKRYTLFNFIFLTRIFIDYFGIKL